MKRKIITNNVKKSPDKYSGILMSVLYHGKTMAVTIYIDKSICSVLPTFDGRSRFHIAEGLDEDECLYLIPHVEGLLAHKSSQGRNIIHLHPGYLEAYKIIWPEGDEILRPIRAKRVDHEVSNDEVKIYCPDWLVRTNK